jgi:hypothetical protein
VDLDDLFERAYREEISDAELSEIVRTISSGEGEDLYTLIQVLGRAGSPKYRKIVEPYLHDVGDPQLSALAVQVLCGTWELAAEYRSELVGFLNGVDWDEDGYTRLQTVSTVGEHLRKNSDVELLRMIYDIFSNSGEGAVIRSAAHSALCRSEGVEWRDIPPASRVTDFSTEINRTVLEGVERKLRRRTH